MGSQVITAFYFFGDIILVFFLAWLIAFVISPVVSWLIERIPALPPAAATVLVYTTSSWSGSRSSSPPPRRWRPRSTSSSVRSRPSAASCRLVRPLPGVARVARLHRDRPGQQANLVLANLNVFAGQLVGPLQQLAVASVSVLGTLLITFFLSVWMVLDRAQIEAFLFRLVPPAYAEEARVLQTATSRSFGGFLLTRRSWDSRISSSP